MKLRRYVPAIAILSFATLSVVVLVGAPNALRVGFPALATVTAAVLFSRSKTAYVRFCLWLWFLSPLVRRLVDYRTEFVPTSTLLLAPFLAASVSGVVLVYHLRTLGQRQNTGALPFVGAFAGIAFGTIYGLIRFPAMDVARGLINWIAPVLFGFFVYQECLRNPARYTELRTTIVRTLLWGTLLMSVYGIVQFFVLPAWDEAWMLGLKDYAFGQPRARELRVFSTMNAPATFAAYAMTGLLAAFTVLTQARATVEPRLRRLAYLTAPAGLLAVALTTSRSVWLGLVCGVIYLALTLPARARVRVVAAVLATFALAGLAAQAPGIHDVVMSRLESFSSGTSDVSANARIDGHLEALGKLASEPLGEGMGSLDAEHATDGSDDRLGPHDSTLLEFLFALGGPGTFVYAFGVGAGLFRVFFPSRNTAAAIEPQACAMRAILFAFFAQCLLLSVMIGVPGFLVWTCLALGLVVNDLEPIAACEGRVQLLTAA